MFSLPSDGFVFAHTRWYPNKTVELCTSQITLGRNGNFLYEFDKSILLPLEIEVRHVFFYGKWRFRQCPIFNSRQNCHQPRLGQGISHGKRTGFLRYAWTKPKSKRNWKKGKTLIRRLFCCFALQLMLKGCQNRTIFHFFSNLERKQIKISAPVKNWVIVLFYST